MTRALRLAALALVIGFPAWGSTTGNGNSTLAPDYTPEAPPLDAVKLRYHFRVDRNEADDLKIVFSGSTVNGEGNSAPHHLEYNIYTNRLTHAEGVCGTYPPLGISTPGEARLTVGVSDYPLLGEFGLKTSDARMFPRQTMLIDNIPGLQSLAVNSQANMNEKEAMIEVFRGGFVNDLSGWKTCWGDRLDGNDPYRAWDIRATLDTGQYRVTVALPEGDAPYLKDVFGIWTEFLAGPGPVRVYYWGIEYQREGDAIWVPIRNWKVLNHEGTPANPSGFGFRVGSYQGRRVIEVSNDPLLEYAGAGETLSLEGSPDAPTVPISWRRLSAGVYELSNQKPALPAEN